MDIFQFRVHYASKHRKRYIKKEHIVWDRYTDEGTHRQCCPSDRVATVWRRCVPPAHPPPAARVV